MTPQKPTGPPGLHVLFRRLRPLLVVIAVVVHTDRHGVVQGAEDKGKAAGTSHGNSLHQGTVCLARGGVMFDWKSDIFR